MRHNRTKHVKCERKVPAGCGKLFPKNIIKILTVHVTQQQYKIIYIIITCLLYNMLIRNYDLV